MHIPHRASLVVALIGVGLCACSSSSNDDAQTSSESELRALTASEKVGDIAFGETRTVTYTDVPLYRALRVAAHRGDVVDAWVRGSSVDAKAWIVAASGRTLATNDDADATTHDAHVQASIKTAGDYYIVLREKNGEDATFSVSLAGASPSPSPTPTPTPTPTPSPQTGLAALPDGTYRIPATSYVHNTNPNACYQRLDVYVVHKSGSGFTVAGGPHVSIDDITASGSISDGAFHGQVIYDPCSYCQDSHSTVYTMNGTLDYTAGKLSLSASYSGGWVQGKSWSGSITDIVFGQDESTLPAGVRRASLTLGPRTDGCAWLWDATVVRLADGTRLMSLPSYLGDVPIDAHTWTAYGCAIRSASLTLNNGIVSANQSMSSSCSDQAQAPSWFAQ